MDRWVELICPVGMLTQPDDVAPQPRNERKLSLLTKKTKNKKACVCEPDIRTQVPLSSIHQVMHAR